jgi:hypothetical protein
VDGFLPPVDNQSWLQYQRQRAERFARERIAAAGAGAGDWIGRATQTVDTLIPDWAQAPPEPPPPPPPPPPPLEPEPVSPAAVVGDWAQGALGRIGQIGSDLGTAASQQARRALPRVVPDATQPGGERVELGGLMRRMPLPPALEPLRPGAEGYAEDVATAGRFVAQRPGEVASAVDTASRFLPGRFTAETLPGVVSGRITPGELGGDVAEALPAAQSLATLIPTPAAQLGNLAANTIEEPLLRGGVNPALATGAGLVADVLTPSPGDAPRWASRAADVAEGAPAGVRGLAERFGTSPAEAVGSGCPRSPRSSRRSAPGTGRLSSGCSMPC